ncbi:BnaA01g19730D [Brassica napus]|uniref:BnaA01g19730D protein n=1 Tax=Brassica napus TaxID=3708 RepID=A0A078H608_BRANA|nr:BnaA01g19730D [Brassica napus]
MSLILVMDLGRKPLARFPSGDWVISEMPVTQQDLKLAVSKLVLYREIARMLADEHRKRVVIVDTSNEIGGDGDVPHSGIGRARRMQIPNVNLQHDVSV